MSKARRWKSFFPITRYTPALLTLLDDNIGRSSGFCEVYVPTLAVYHGLTVAPLPENMTGPMSPRVIRKNRKPQLFNDNKVHHKYEYERMP